MDIMFIKPEGQEATWFTYVLSEMSVKANDLAHKVAGTGRYKL